jgi:hypothetical protein
MVSVYKTYRLRAQTSATDVVGDFALPIPISLVSGDVHLVAASVVSATAATIFVRIGYAPQNSAIPDADTLILKEGWLRGEIPSGGFTSFTSNGIGAESLNWSGDVPFDAQRSLEHFVRGMIWSKMGSTVTFHVRAVVRFDQ